MHDIEEDEELTIAYDVDIANGYPEEIESVFFRSYEIGQARFRKRYGFHCDCEVCRKKYSDRDGDRDSWVDDDADGETIAELAEEIKIDAAKNGAISSTVFPSSRKLVELMIKHGGNTWEAGKA